MAGSETIAGLAKVLSVLEQLTPLPAVKDTDASTQYRHTLIDAQWVVRAASKELLELRQTVDSLVQ